MNPPLTAADFEYVHQKLEDLDMLDLIQMTQLNDWTVREIYRSNQALFHKHSRPGYIAFWDEWYSFPIEEAVSSRLQQKITAFIIILIGRPAVI